jgi:hypothetical protein
MIQIPDEFVAPFYPNVSEGFVLDEDRALHAYLKDPPLMVWDNNGAPRNVGVWFGHPDREIREQKYPYMIISLIDITEASNRVMSGTRHWDNASVPLWALPPNVVIGKDGRTYNGDGIWNDVWNDNPSHPILSIGENPIPVQIDYTVRAYSRHPRHDREIIGGFLSRKVNYRYSWLPMGHIDGTNRRMELLSVGHSETQEMGKRLFMSVFTVRVDSWMPAGDPTVVEGIDVLKVLGTVHHRDIRGTVVATEHWTNERPTSEDPYEGV